MNKKVTIGILGTVAAASIATNLLVEPEELVHTEEYLAEHARVEDASQAGDYSVTYTETAELTGADAVRAWIIRLPVALKAVLLLPLWALGAIPVAIGTGIASALAPFWGQIGGFLLQMAVVIGVFCLVYKLLFPDKKLKTLFKRKNLTWLVLGAGGVTGANLILSQVWSQWSVWRTVLFVAAGFGVLCLLWARICKKLPGPKAQQREAKLELSYDGS